MTLKDIYNKTNDNGREFLSFWTKDQEKILGLEDDGESDWFYVIMDDARNNLVISLPRENSSAKATFFGDLRYYVRDRALRRIGWNKQHTDEGFREIVKAEREYISKYKLDPKYFN